MKKRVPRFSAIAIHVAPGGDLGYEGVMRIVRDAIPPEEFTRLGVTDMRCGGNTQTGDLPKEIFKTGDLLWEIPGRDKGEAADALADRMREAFFATKWVSITRLVRTMDMRLSGFDLSVEPNEIANAIVRIGGCSLIQCVYGRSAARGAAIVQSGSSAQLSLFVLRVAEGDILPSRICLG